MSKIFMKSKEKVKNVLASTGWAGAGWYKMRRFWENTFEHQLVE